MDTRGNERLRELLAAEYAVGTLRGAARRRFESWMRADADLAARTRAWEERLQPFATSLAPATPPARVWARIEARLHRPARPAASWWDRVAFWRGFSGIAVAVAVFSVGVTMRPVPLPVPERVDVMPEAVATIVDPKSGKPVAVVMHGKAKRELYVKVASDVDVPAGMGLQLWMAPTDREGMESVGMVPAGARTNTMGMPVTSDAMLGRTKAFGLSLEPAGGSPQPTRVLGLGMLMRTTT